MCVDYRLVYDVVAEITYKHYAAVHLHLAVAVDAFACRSMVFEVHVTAAHIHCHVALDTRRRTVIVLFGCKQCAALGEHRQCSVEHIHRLLGIESASRIAFCLYAYIAAVHVDVGRLHSVALLACG